MTPKIPVYDWPNVPLLGTFAHYPKIIDRIMKKLLVCLAILLACLTYSLRSSAQAVEVGDSLALVDLYNSTGGPSWVNHTNWLTSNPVSTWYGVSTLVLVDSPRVFALSLQGNNLIGTLPASIGNLTGLSFLTLPYNKLSGSLPSTLPNMVTPSFPSCTIDVSHNELTGMIPAFGIGKNVFLNICYNNFTYSTLEPSILSSPYHILADFLVDSIEADLPLIQQGNVLSVAAGGAVGDNTYTWYENGVVVATRTGDSTFTTTGTGTYGVVVTNVNVPSLALYSIQSINVQDSLALVDLYNGTAGTNWIVKNNWLTSAPAASWEGVTARFGRVAQLNLPYDNLFGPIPSSFGNLQAAYLISLDDNLLSGDIPTSLGNLQSATALSLSENKLSGPIPASLGNLPQLRNLDLGDNQLTGGIPSALSNLTQLQNLTMDQNQLSGAIPPSLGNLANLTLLDLSFNQLTDTIPAALGNLGVMTELYLNNNQLSGQIPASVGRFQHLVTLDFNGNYLTGSIPDSICNAHINHVLLNNNALTGTIPDSIAEDTALIDLEVRNNNLSGTIKANFDTIHSYVYYLGVLDISGNKYNFSVLPIPFDPYGQLTYAPQQNIPLTRVESTLSVSAGGNSANSIYTLFENGIAIATQTGDSAFSIQGLGNYNIVTTNPVGPLLTLYSDTLKLGLVLPDSSISTTQTITGTAATDINTNIFRIATITPTAGVDAVSGEVTATETIDPSVQTYNREPYVTRHYDITPASNASTAQATVMLYYTQSDFDAYNAYVTANNLSIPLLPSGGVNNGNVIITQYHGMFTGTSSPGNYNQGSEEIMPTVTWDATDGWWIVSFPVSGFSGFFLSTSAVPFPLTLLTFTGAPNGYAVDLQWTTTDEENASVFGVQRSADGVAFNTIGSVPAKNTLGEYGYVFTDANPLAGNNFYRLKLQDLGGQFTYSPIVEVSMAAQAGGLLAYPNPAVSNTSIIFQSAGAAPYTIRITDASGKLMAQLAGMSAVGSNKIDLDVHSFASGAYTVTITDEVHGRRSIQLLKE
jgi:Leucine-rich repeat (LRR) protein